MHEWMWKDVWKRFQQQRYENVKVEHEGRRKSSGQAKNLFFPKIKKSKQNKSQLCVHAWEDNRMEINPARRRNEWDAMRWYSSSFLNSGPLKWGVKFPQWLCALDFSLNSFHKVSISYLIIHENQ